MDKQIERWNNYTEKIIERFNKSLNYGKESLIDIAAETDNNFLAVIQNWQIVFSKLNEIIPLISKTWESQMTSVNQFDSDIKYNHIKLTKELEKKLENSEILLLGEIAKSIYSDTIKQKELFDFKCSQCGADISAKPKVFISHYVECEYCKSINTFTPGMALKQLEIIVEYIVKLETLDDYNIIVDLKKKVEGEHSETNFKEYASKYLEYYNNIILREKKYITKSEEEYKELLEKKKKELEEIINEII